METTGDLVAPFGELGARVEGGQHRLQRGQARGLVGLHGDAAPVVYNLHRPVRTDGDADLGAEASHGLIHRVVHNLVDQVVKPALVRAADVHAWTATHRIAALKHLNVFGGIA